MQEMMSRVKNIQNKAKSLKWGSCMYNEHSIVFVVGHATYRRDLYFKVQASVDGACRVIILRDSGEEERFGKTCNNFDMLLAEIKQLLAKEFPATGGAN